MRKNIFLVCLTTACINTGFGLLKDLSGKLPMIDGNKRPLTVDLDVSEFNRKLQKVVEEDLVEELDDKFRQYIKSTEFDDLIKTTLQAMTTIMEKQMEVTMERKVSQLNEKIKKLNDEVAEGVIRERKQTEIIKDQARKIQMLNDTVAEDHETYAFFAFLSSNKEALSKSSVLMFDKVQLNMGGHYDVSTGKYTCQKSGLYTFSWTTLSKDNTDFTSDLIVNGEIMARNAVDNDKTGDSMSGSVTAVVRMKTGQKTWIGVELGTFVRGNWDGEAATLFSGYRIQ